MIGGHRPGVLEVDSLDDRRSWGILNSRANAARASLRRSSLWIVPDLWKTHRTRFPQGRWTALKNAPPTRSTRHSHSVRAGMKRTQAVS